MTVYSGKIILHSGAGNEHTVKITHIPTGMTFDSWTDAIAHERWATEWEALFNRKGTQ